MEKLKSGLIIVLVLFLAGLVFPAGETGEKLYYESRDQIPERYRWKIEDIFPSVDTFNTAFARLEQMIPQLESYRGRLSESAQVLSEALELMWSMRELQDELVVYAGQNWHMNTADLEAKKLYNRYNSLAAKVDQAMAFVEPEIARIPTGKLEKFRKNKALKTYNHYLDNLVRQKPHIQSPEVEQVLASAKLMGNAPYEAYASMVYTDIDWPVIKDEEGEELKIVPAQYYSYVSRQDRRVRRDAALALFGAYQHFANTFTSTYSGHLHKDIFYAKNRGFERSIDAKMFEVNVPYEVIETLKNTVHENFPLLHRYASLRKNVLEIDEFHVYDLYVSLVPEAEQEITFDAGYEIALDFWDTVYGEEYYSIGRKAREENWIDVYTNKGKRGGAYSWGSYNSHPYILLNWGGTMEDVFTLVHEMGHSIHTYFSNTHQPFHDAGYSLFVAEVASVTSEALFLDYMLERAKTDIERLALLEMYMGNITGTFLRQVFFHEFEELAHRMAEADEPLTSKSLGDLYAGLWNAYYGPELILDEEFHAGWARIPHFYRTFYVWVYATSFAAGEAIAERVRNEGDTAVQDYLEMLKLGGSVYPLEALETAGVDMTDPAVIQTVMDRYEETLSRMEELLLK